MDKNIRIDIENDIDEFNYLFLDIKEKINIIRSIISGSKSYIQSDNRRFILQMLNLLDENIVTGKSRVNLLDNSDCYQEKKLSVYELLRHSYQIVGSLHTITDYQSPAYDFSGISMAGRQTGTIEATVNDYKRDQHRDGINYENKFLKEYIDTPLSFKFPVHVNAVHSGMAAFTTILNFLILENKITASVIVGQDTYFESKVLLKKTFKDKYIEVDENDTGNIILKIKNHKPSAIFLDTIGNTPRMKMPDIDKILEAASQADHDLFAVIDNSSAGPGYQPFKKFNILQKHFRIISYESLNKFHQFGMDRVLGGIIISAGKDTEKIFDYRVHLGTNILDSSLMSLPTPNRKIMDMRLKKLQRNVLVLTDNIANKIKNDPNTSLKSIVHPAYRFGNLDLDCFNKKFCGPFFMLNFKPQFRSVRYYQKFISQVMKKAKSNKIFLNAGTSFGLPITRIYLTALRTHTEEPFIRISSGTENYRDILKIAELLNNTL